MEGFHGKFRKVLLLSSLLVVAAIYYFIVKANFLEHFLANPQSLRELILSFGILAPLGVILLQALQTTFSIIPSQLTTIIAGFIFGPILGLLYSLIGSFIGSSIVFFLARRYGKKMVLKLFEKEEIVHFHALFKRKKGWAVLFARVTPIFPNDLVSFVAGLTEITFKNFIFFSTLGFTFQMLILTYFGATLSAGKVSLPFILISVLVSLLMLIVLFKNKIKKIFIKDLHKIENEIEEEFRKIENYENKRKMLRNRK